jgi:outer membrane protein assembly factor BamB
MKYKTKKNLIMIMLCTISVFSAHALAGNIYTPHERHQRLGALDTVTGTFTDVGSFELPESVIIASMAFGIDGTLYGLTNRTGTKSGLSQLVVVDRVTAQVTPVGFPNAIMLIAFDIGPDGTAYVAGRLGDPNLYSIDTTTGELTLIGDTGIVDEHLMDFAFDSSGTMWATTANELYVIDTSTGAAQHAVTITGLDAALTDPNASIMGIMFDENDVLYATAFSLVESTPLFIIDTVTGQAMLAAQVEMSFPHGGDIFVDPR